MFGSFRFFTFESNFFPDVWEILLIFLQWCTSAPNSLLQISFAFPQGKIENIATTRIITEDILCIILILKEKNVYLLSEYSM